MAKVIEARKLAKRYKGAVEALREISFEVDENEFFIIMGPSGCGKSTLLRIIAGILDYDSGELYIKGEDMKNVPPHRRDVSMMLENFALFPHMTVYENIAFGLRMLGKDKDEIDREVRKMTRLLHIEGLEERMPNEISGGQRQRVALARALIIRPSVLLLDEPLSHVDYRLQRKFAEMLKEVHREIGGVFMLTTHDQEHGLSLADRMLIMNSGLVEQIGTPTEIYNDPQTLFAARFVGELNTFAGTVEEISPDAVWVKTEFGTFKARHPATENARDLVGRRVAYIVRPEHVRVSREDSGQDNRLSVYFNTYYYFGHFLELVFSADAQTRVKSVISANEPFTAKVGEQLTLTWPYTKATIVSKPSVVEGVDIEELIYGK
ncbi:MAG: ABC transporter ATP-binding protein [Aigarchaeota archaeon]|nr:ABC transporter ATP-binding protein [Candidatus Pelearchaeum maunauluense]